MKVIDLLNKIANGEEVPKVIDYENNEFVFSGYDSASKNYYNKFEDLFEVLDGSMLNDEVEILEEEKKIPEKLDWDRNDFTYPEGNLMSEETANMLMEIQDKINNIIDILNKGENK